MNEPEHFEDFYTNKLAPEIPRLRAECKKADSWIFTGVLVTILAVLSFISYYNNSINGNLATLLIIFFISMLAVSIYNYGKRKDRFTDDFKTAIVKAVIDEVCPGLVYKPDETVTPREYKTSSLFRYRYDYFDGDDYIEGVIDNVPFHCSELQVQSDYAGNKQVAVFKGLFFVAKINSRFTGGTYLWPRGHAQLASSVMDEEYRLLPMPHVRDVAFNDAPFNHHFRVCSTWPAQAYEILTDDMRDNLVRICDAMKLRVSFSFAAGRCFIAVPVADDLFEPTDYDPGDKEAIKSYFITIGMIVNMIKRSGLSTLQ